MNASTGLEVLGRFALGFLPVLLGAALKASLVFALVAGVTRLMKQAHPRLRHFLWLTVIASYLAVLILALGAPLFLLGPASEPRPGSGVSAISSSLLPSPADQGIARAIVYPQAVASWALFWAAALFLVWVCGAAAGVARLALGRLETMRLVARPGQGPRTAWGLVPAELLARTGLRRAVRVLESSRCRTPFTYGLLRPRIVLPAGMSDWPGDRVQGVLVHELAHIRRGDCLTRILAHVVCSLFWFVPFVWSAYAQLTLEQEEACDAKVVESGVDREAYAACILETVRNGRQAVWSAALGSPKRRKRVLVARIQAILGGGTAMKKRSLLFAFAVVGALALVLLAGAGRSESMSAEVAWGRFVGTWVNEEYVGIPNVTPPQKTVIRQGFTAEDWAKVTDASRDAEWKVRVKKSWTDRKGNVYCQVFWQYTERYPWSGLMLLRVDRSAKVLEMVNRRGLEGDEYPTEIDPTANSDERDRYLIYHRQ